MIHERKKMAKIIEELTMYFFALGATKIESCLEKEKDQYIIRFHTDYQAEYRNNLTSLQKYLNEPRNASVEDIYWELAGSGDPGETSQLLLVGMMTDRVDIVIRDKDMELALYRYRGK